MLQPDPLLLPRLINQILSSPPTPLLINQIIPYTPTMTHKQGYLPVVEGVIVEVAVAQVLWVAHQVAVVVMTNGADLGNDPENGQQELAELLQGPVAWEPEHAVAGVRLEGLPGLLALKV